MAIQEYGPILSFVYETGSLLMLHRRYIKQFFSQVNLGIKPGARVLDAGCGGGRFSLSLLASLKKKNIETVIDAFDISEEMLKKAEKRAKRVKLRQGIKLYYADSRNLAYAKEFIDGKVTEKTVSFQDNLYDVVICSGMLEHIPPEDTATTIEDLTRVLKPEGKFVFLFVRNNKLGRLTGKFFHCAQLIDEKNTIEQFYSSGIRDFEEFQVKSHHPYLKKVTKIYVGTKTV